MILQKYVYEDLIIEVKFNINYVITEIYRDYVKVHESITYLDGVKNTPLQIPMHLIEMVMGESFELKNLKL